MGSVKVLIVDWETEFAAIVANRLGSWGYATTVASSKGEAMAVLAEQRPDVMVIVLRDKESWGLDLVRLALAGEQPAHVILLCGKGATVAGMRGMRLGAFDCLPLPLELGVLIDRIRTATGSNLSLADENDEL